MKLDGQYLVHTKKNGQPYQLWIDNIDMKEKFNIYVDFSFYSGGFEQFEKAHKQGFLNAASTIAHFSIILNGRKFYLYRRDTFAYYYIIWNDNVVRVGFE